MDCYGLLDLHNDHLILFVPRLDNLYKIWMNVLTKEDASQFYQVEVRYVDEIEETLKSFQGTLFLNDGVNSDSGLKTILPDEKYLKDKVLDRETLYEILAESRVVKNDEEILALRWASQITAEAHCEVLRKVKENMRESQVESHFNFFGQQNYYTGRVAPYLSICGCGHTAATLHYNVNNQTLKNGQTMLTDQGHTFHHYISDVTTVFPVNGKFTQKQAEIYNIVLRAQRNVFE